MKKTKVGARLKKCKICSKERMMNKHRVTCCSSCARKYRNLKR